MPFIGGWIGYEYAPEKVITLEDIRVVEKKQIEEYPMPSEKIYNLTEGFTDKIVTINLPAERFLHFSDEYKLYEIWLNETVIDRDIPIVSIVEIPYLQRKESYSNEELLNIVTNFSEASLTKRITGEEEVYDVKLYPEGVEFHVENGLGYPTLFLWFDDETETTLLIESLDDDSYHSDTLHEVIGKILVTSSIDRENKSKVLPMSLNNSDSEETSTVASDDVFIQGSVESAKQRLLAPAQTQIADFNLDEDAYPRDMLYPDGGSGNNLTLEEVSSHNTMNDCWVIYANGVHDISSLFTLEDIFPAIRSLGEKCGTDIDSYIQSQPVEAGSLNTARFAYAINNFWTGYWVDR